MAQAMHNGLKARRGATLLEAHRGAGGQHHRAGDGLCPLRPLG